MGKTLLLIIILLISIMWQPGHNYLMASGMSMSPKVVPQSSQFNNYDTFSRNFVSPHQKKIEKSRNLPKYVANLIYNL